MSAIFLISGADFHGGAMKLQSVVIKRKLCLFSVLFALFVNSPALMAECNKELVNGWGGRWEPFLMGTYDKPSGLDMELLDAVVKASGCTWRNTRLEIPWARHLQWVKSGELDLATAVSWTQERAEYAFFTKPYRNEYVAIYVRKTDVEKYSRFSLEELAREFDGIGIEFGNVYGNEMDVLLEAMGERVQRVASNKQNMAKLIGKRIDGYLGHIPYESIEVRSKGYENEIVTLPVSVVKTGSVHFMLSKIANTEKIFRALDAGLAKIKADGTYDQIIKKYSDQYGLSYW